MLHERIKNDMREATKARDALRRDTLRGVLAAFVNDLVARRHLPHEKLADDEALAVIARLAKQRRESIAEFTRGKRDDLVAKETAELAILAEYLPEQMPDEDIERLARDKKDALGIADKSGVGKLIGALMADLKGRADGAAVKRAVDKLLG